MDAAKEARLEAAGYRVGTVEEFLDLTPAQNAMVEARVAPSLALRERRQAARITQTALAQRLGSSQSRIAKIEADDPTVSLDLMARAFFETGGTVKELVAALAGEIGHNPTDRDEDDSTTLSKPETNGQ